MKEIWTLEHLFELWKNNKHHHRRPKQRVSSEVVIPRQAAMTEAHLDVLLRRTPAGVNRRIVPQFVA